jgi:prephenate dehydrogenase
MIAYTSQLAHVVSSAYVRDELACGHVGFSAGSYQDMTRVATMDPETWSDLFLANREALSETIVRLRSRLDEFREALDNCDSERLKRLIAQGREAKETRG